MRDGLFSQLETADEGPHKVLVKKAAAWLRGQGRVVICTESVAWCCAESPDVIGWEYTGVSTVIECKVSRSDFLADRKKPHRQKDGLGNFRYFAAPKGLITPEELPEGWGLLQTSGAGLRTVCKPTRFEANLQGERVLLVQINRHVWNPEWRLKHYLDIEPEGYPAA